MAFCAAQILELATDLHADVGCPSSITPSYISGWFVQSGHLGDLNNKLGTCFYLSGSSPCIAGGFGPEEAAIYSKIYTLRYYNGVTQGLLTSAANPWTALSEGDSKIVREGPAATSKVLVSLIKENNAQLRLAIHDWKRNHSIPGQVVAESLASYPSPS